jgi:hypothetical protein
LVPEPVTSIEWPRAERNGRDRRGNRGVGPRGRIDHGACAGPAVDLDGVGAGVGLEVADEDLAVAADADLVDLERAAGDDAGAEIELADPRRPGCGSL